MPRGIEMKLICIGDSLTFGYGVNASQRWTNIAERMSGMTVVNQGINGDTTGGMLVRLNDILKSGDMRDCVIMLTGGGNDIFFSGSDSTARQNTAAMVQHVLAAGAMPIVGITTSVSAEKYIGQWSSVVDFENAEKKVVEYRSWLRKYCMAFNIDYIDFDDAVSPEMLIDGLHPDVQGHLKIGTLVAEKLKMLEEKFDV